MAVAAVNLLATGSAVSASSFATASVNFVSGRMYLLSVRSKSASGGSNIPTVTGGGQTWALVVSRQDAGDVTKRLSLFRCIASSTQSDFLTIDFNAQAQTTGIGWILDEVTGVAVGSNGANAVRQSVVGDSNEVAVASFSLTLAAFGNVNNATYGTIYATNVIGAITQEAGYTELADNGTGLGKGETMFLAANDTGPSWTLDTRVVGAAIAIELAADTAAITLTAETGAGTDALSVTDASIPKSLTAESGTATDGFAVAGVANLTSGTLWVGRFVEAEPAYTLQNEIINYAHLDEGRQRPNIIIVDGELDSWTEYDRDDLTSREAPITAYFDLPELHSPGAVAQRAIQEQQEAARAASPGGDIVWNPLITRMDRIYWVGSDSSKYEGRIEAIEVTFDQGVQPFQRCTIDLGLMVLCPPDEETTYLARDLFDRDTPTGIGTADIGGSWTTY